MAGDRELEGLRALERRLVNQIDRMRKALDGVIAQLAGVRAVLEPELPGVSSEKPKK